MDGDTPQGQGLLVWLGVAQGFEPRTTDLKSAAPIPEAMSVVRGSEDCEALMAMEGGCFRRDVTQPRLEVSLTAGSDVVRNQRGDAAVEVRARAGRQRHRMGPATL